MNTKKCNCGHEEFTDKRVHKMNCPARHAPEQPTTSAGGNGGVGAPGYRCERCTGALGVTTYHPFGQLCPPPPKSDDIEQHDKWHKAGWDDGRRELLAELREKVQRLPDTEIEYVTDGGKRSVKTTLRAKFAKDLLALLQPPTDKEKER